MIFSLRNVVIVSYLSLAVCLSHDTKAPYFSAFASSGQNEEKEAIYQWQWSQWQSHHHTRQWQYSARWYLKIQWWTSLANIWEWDGSADTKRFLHINTGKHSCGTSMYCYAGKTPTSGALGGLSSLGGWRSIRGCATSIQHNIGLSDSMIEIAHYGMSLVEEGFNRSQWAIGCMEHWNVAAATTHWGRGIRCASNLVGLSNDAKKHKVVQFYHRHCPSTGGIVINDLHSIMRMWTTISSGHLSQSPKLLDFPSGVWLTSNRSIHEWQNWQFHDWCNHFKYWFIISRPVPWEQLGLVSVHLLPIKVGIDKVNSKATWQHNAIGQGFAVHL